MYTYIIRRVLFFIPMLVAVSLLVFTLSYMAPGDPLTGEKVDPTVDAEVFEERREALGLNDPFLLQYMNWLGSVVKGDLGESIHYTGRTVEELILSRLGNTLSLAIFSVCMTIMIALPMGVYAARKPYSLFDYGATVFSYLGLAMPNFFIGLLFLSFFSFQLGWLPSQGSISVIGLTGMEYVWDRIRHLILPGMTLALASTAIYMRYIRSEMLDVLGSPFIRTAKAKGLGETSILYKHALRHALTPVITLLGFEFGTLLSGAVITEAVFNYPGLGTLFLDSVMNRDYPVIMGINLILSATILVGNLLADIFYATADPRVRYD